MDRPATPSLLPLACACMQALRSATTNIRYTSTSRRSTVLIILILPPHSSTTQSPSPPATMGDAAEWETSKENVMPLKHGRNVTKLNAALAEK